MFSSLKVISRRIAGHTTLAISALVTALALTAAPTQAAPITYAYQGVVDTSSGGAAFSAFIGQTATMEYTFDDTSLDANSDPNVGSYALSSISLTIGSNVWSLAGGSNGIADVGSDVYEVTIGSAVLFPGPTVGGASATFAFMTFIDSTATALSSDNLPTTQPDPADFNSTTIGLDFGGTGNLRVNGLITIADTEVPEPGSLIIFGFGLAGLGYIRRRRTA